MISGWVFRGLVTVHLVAIFAQPVFAGVYLSGDFDGLRMHAMGANITTSIGYLQVFAAVVVWIRLRQVWPFAASLGVVAAETVQYFAGQDGALWLHLPLGVVTIAAVVLMFVASWRQPVVEHA
ncbi:hypothetical protein [Kribbella sp.]|uniref:hypothetical protein n=1 Tax=Kribbella sp. TaxID=1871183 RepID=UPI002D2F2CD3|nr:hypothetical protein [Kribbella sp.]HZX06214.1 hypothetical protein [Kribbella sp.]